MSNSLIFYYKTFFLVMQSWHRNWKVLQAFSSHSFSEWMPLSCGNMWPIVLVLLLVFITLLGEMLLPWQHCPEQAKWRSALQMNLHVWLSESVMVKEKKKSFFPASKNLCLYFLFWDRSLFLIAAAFNHLLAVTQMFSLTLFLLHSRYLLTKIS